MLHQINQIGGEGGGGHRVVLRTVKLQIKETTLIPFVISSLFLLLLLDGHEFHLAKARYVGQPI